MDYYKYGDTATIILLRNAIHHRDHLLFKSWNYEMGLNDGLKKMAGIEILLVNYATVDKEARVSEYYFKLNDFYERLKHPNVIKYSDQYKKLFEKELLFTVIQKATSGKYSVDQVYINIIPIFISAIQRVFLAFKKVGIKFDDFDSSVYQPFFINNKLVDLSKITYKKIRIPIN